MSVARPLLDRIIEKVSIEEGGCWLWRGTAYGKYGYIAIGSVPRRAHRVVYEILRGNIPDGLFLDHLCRRTLCVNPQHLEPVTPAENVHRGNAPAMRTRRRGYCLRGHPLIPENRRPNRSCRLCANEAQSRRWANSPEHRRAMRDAARQRYATDDAHRGRVLAKNRAKYARTRDRAAVPLTTPRRQDEEEK